MTHNRSFKSFIGRGAVFNPPNRFEPLQYGTTPDLAEFFEMPDPEQKIPTRYYVDHSKTVLAKNDSPDLGFTYSINPYRGCEHGCVYCLDGDTLILMADGSTKPLKLIRKSDEVYGTARRGWYRRLVRTNVLAHWVTRRPAFRITLSEGTQLIASGDHRFLTDRGWKFVTDAGQGDQRRPHLTSNNKLMGFGTFTPAVPPNSEYKRGYLCGLIRGDGLLSFYRYERPGRRHGNQWHFRLALKDRSALERADAYLAEFGIETNKFIFQERTSTTAEMRAIRTHARGAVQTIQKIVRWPATPSGHWYRGYLAGIFDAEGSYSQGVLRIVNTNRAILSYLEAALMRFSFSFVDDRLHGKRALRLRSIRIRGGIVEHLRFFHITQPVIRRKQNIEGCAIKTKADLRVVNIEALGERELYDITTETGDFIANGVISHNCYARPSHEYLGFSSGLDFETKIMVKLDAPELLAKEFAGKLWKPQTVVFSGNTDCYQPAERKLQLTRRCLEVFLKYRNPVSLITKNALIQRDIDLLGDLASMNLVFVIISITTLKQDLVKKMEPRTSAPHKRLETIEALARCGIPIGVNVAPVIPGLTETEIPAILEEASRRGAKHAGYTIVRLSYALKDLFVDWLNREYPEKAAKVIARIKDIRGGKLSESEFGKRMSGQGEFAETVEQLFETTCNRLHLNETPVRLATERFNRGEQAQMRLAL